MDKMRQVGLHLRVTSNLLDMAQLAIRLNLKIFQCFMVHQNTGLYLEPTHEEIKQFKALRLQHFKTLYLHASYWINLASKNFDNTLYLLKREINLGLQLGFDVIVIHPGAWSSWQTKTQGIDAICYVLNEVLHQCHDITILLENMPFGPKTLGGDLYDFQELRKKIKYPEKIKFCIDTAHAFSYGYDIRDENGQLNFVELIEAAIGIDAVKLLHVNDTQENLGSKRDKHEVIGKGNIGFQALKTFVQNPKCKEIACILELPEMAESDQKIYFDMVQSWL